MTVKLKRIVTKLGEIDLECFARPPFDKREYYLSQTQVAETIGEHRMSVSRFLEGNEAKSLLGNDIKCHKMPFEGGRTPISVVPPMVCSLYWLHYSNRGNPKAKALAAACIVEALERRIDRAFEVVLTEEQRDERFQERLHGMEIRKDACRHLSEWMRTPTGEHDCKDMKPHDVYAWLTNAVYFHVFGKTAQQLRDEFGIPKNHTVRDYSDTYGLREIAWAEDRVISLLEEDRNPIRTLLARPSRRIKFHLAPTIARKLLEKAKEEVCNRKY